MMAAVVVQLAAFQYQEIESNFQLYRRLQQIVDYYYYSNYVPSLAVSEMMREFLVRN